MNDTENLREKMGLAFRDGYFLLFFHIPAKPFEPPDRLITWKAEIWAILAAADDQIRTNN